MEGRYFLVRPESMLGHANFEVIPLKCWWITGAIELNSQILNDVASDEYIVVIWMRLVCCIHFEKVSLHSIGSEFR